MVSMVLCAVFIKEKITLFMIIGTVMIVAGTLLMMNREELAALKNKNILKSDQRWILFSGLSAVFASVSYVIVKADRAPIDTNVTSTFRYVIVVLTLWAILFARNKRRQADEAIGIRRLPGRSSRKLPRGKGGENCREQEALGENGSRQLEGHRGEDVDVHLAGAAASGAGHAGVQVPVSGQSGRNHDHLPYGHGHFHHTVPRLHLHEADKEGLDRFRAPGPQAS